MIVMVIEIITMLFMLASLVYTMGSGSILENGAYYMGITIPKEHRDEEPVQNIKAEYIKSWKKISLAGLVTCLTILVFYDYVSVQVVYILTWFFVLMYAYQNSLKRCGWKLYNWKITQAWYKGSENGGRLCRIDTALTSSKKRMPVSPYWGALPMAMVMVCVFRYCAVHFSVVSCSFAACAVMFFAVYFVIARSRTKVYCDDSEVNIAINRSVKYEWSRCMMLHSFMAAFIALVLSLRYTSGTQLYDGKVFVFLGYAMIMLCSLGSLAALIAVYANVQKVKNQAGTVQYYDDDDIYYLTGKKNPNAPRMQEKRVGIGFSLNAGSRVDLIVVGITMLFVIGLAIFLAKYDLADVSLDITSDDSGRKIAYVEAAGERSGFYLDEITAVELLDALPDMSKNVGYDGTVYNIGSFDVSGYGKCDTYICLKTHMAVVVKTADRVYVFNDETADGTRHMYESLR